MERTKQKFEFGTDGWRAVISDEFTFKNVSLVAQAVADFIKSDERKEIDIYKRGIEYRDFKNGLVIGYDTRFLSDKFARKAAEVISANDIPVFLVKSATPTPVVSFAVKDKKTAGAVMITASHNPPEYNGIKFKPEYGGSALPECTALIEKCLNRILDENKEVKVNPVAKIEEFDPFISYFNQIKSFIDFDLIGSANLKVVADPMYGAGRGWLSRILNETGLNVIEIHNEANPYFGGLNPEPIGKHIQALIDTVKIENANLGIALDGDADRIGLVDETGEFINSHQIFSLLLDYLVKDFHLKGGVVKTFSTTQMINLLADEYKLRLYETPIGFKYICRLMLTEDILIGGEESGGIGIKNHIPERDGILCGLLLLQMMVVRRIDDLMDRIGHFYYDRRDFHFSDNDEKQRVLDKIQSIKPGEVFFSDLVRTETLDGVKFFLNDKSWILFRASGTEPMLRVYAESFSRERVSELLDIGEAQISHKL
ncbi:MAG: phosphoglucomutase/phosphomannomutase family protein [Actinobacteria bacterium]|nr:phosphoglucomutase/phosphomannomutase family protein [Actinomycetota bacterium]